MMRTRCISCAKQRSAKRCRRGSALLLCTLAIAVISLASIAIVRSNQRGIANVDGIRVSRQARYDADGIVQRSIAALRVDPTISGSLPLSASTPKDATVVLTPLSASETQIQVYLYDQSKVPARDLVVDPASLGGPVKSPVTPPVVPITPVKVLAPVKPGSEKPSIIRATR